MPHTHKKSSFYVNHQACGWKVLVKDDHYIVLAELQSMTDVQLVEGVDSFSIIEDETIKKKELVYHARLHRITTKSDHVKMTPNNFTNNYSFVNKRKTT